MRRRGEKVRGKLIIVEVLFKEKAVKIHKTQFKVISRYSGKMEEIEQKNRSMMTE